MKVKGYLAAILVFALCLAPVQDSVGRSKKKKGKTETAAPKKKTPYQEFIGKKGLVSSRGTFSVYLDGDKIFIEFPDSLMGGEFCMSSHVWESGDVMLAGGFDISGKSRNFRISRTDSLVVLKTPRPPLMVSERDSSILAALELSCAEPVKYAFPIKYRNADSTAVVFEATGLFDSSDEESVSLYASWFGNSRIVESTRIDDLSEIIDVKSFPGSLAVVQDATYDIKLATGFESRLTLSMVTTLSLLSDNLMPVREADDRIGLRKLTGQHYDSRKGFKNVNLASRWDLRDGKKLRVYLDTLMPPTWQNAVREGLCAWNPAFKKAGFAEDVIEVFPYPADTTFSAFNPSVNTVSFCGGGGRNLSARISTDSRTAEIRNFSMTVPGDFLLSLLFSSSFAIGDVDSRYACYDLPDDAVCEVLKAQVMKLFGLCLGLGKNFAGSTAYTPEELRSPEFTQSHGITSSVTDNVLFNILARPGDKEKGVVTVMDRVGPYDELVIEWLYSSYAEDSLSKAKLDSLIDSKSGQREYLYIPLQENNPDPRANAYDLGSDPFEAFNSAMSHLYFAAENAHKWFASEDIPEQEFKNLYVDWIWLKIIDNTKILSPLVGGLYSENVRADGSATHLRPVPEKAQRAAVELVLKSLMDVSWLDANKELMTISGAYSTYSYLSYMNVVGQSQLLPRLPFITRSQRLTGSSYSREKFLSDFEKQILANVSEGRLSPREDEMIFRYLRALLSLSPLMKSNFETAFKMNQKSLDDGLYMPLSGVSPLDVEGQDIVARKSFENVRKTLVSGRSRATDHYVAGKIDFLIYVIDVSLKK